MTISKRMRKLRVTHLSAGIFEPPDFYEDPQPNEEDLNPETEGETTT